MQASWDMNLHSLLSCKEPQASMEAMPRPWSRSDCCHMWLQTSYSVRALCRCSVGGWTCSSPAW